MAELTPFVRFNDGKCREAMQFYKSIFGGELTFMTVGESPHSKDMTADKQDLIMHSELKKGKMAFSGSDMMMDKAVVGDNVGMSLNCENEAELKMLFDKLSEGGSVFMPIEDNTSWGAMFGWVTDRYCIEWMLNWQKKK